MKRVLYWHRNDLRLHDNRCLLEAAEHEVLPVYVIEETADAQSATFLLESLADLKASYAELEITLLVHAGNAVDVLASICLEQGIQEIHCQSLRDDTQLDDLCVRTGLPVRTYDTLMLYTQEQLAELSPGSFEDFLRLIDETIYVPLAFGTLTHMESVSVENQPLPSIKQLGYERTLNSKLCFEPGESEILQHATENIVDISYDESTVWIELGCISVRTLYYLTLEYEKIHDSAETKRLRRELLYRDYEYYFES